MTAQKVDDRFDDNKIDYKPPKPHIFSNEHLMLKQDSKEKKFMNSPKQQTGLVNVGSADGFTSSKKEEFFYQNKLPSP